MAKQNKAIGLACIAYKSLEICERCRLATYLNFSDKRETIAERNPSLKPR
jgi:hypothetical protein